MKSDSNSLPVSPVPACVGLKAVAEYLAEEPPESSRRTPLPARVYFALFCAFGEGRVMLRREDLEKATGLPLVTLRYSLKALEKQGLVRRHRAGALKLCFSLFAKPQPADDPQLLSDPQAAQRVRAWLSKQVSLEEYTPVNLTRVARELNVSYGVVERVINELVADGLVVDRRATYRALQLADLFGQLPQLDKPEDR